MFRNVGEPKLAPHYLVNILLSGKYFDKKKFSLLCLIGIVSI